MNHEKAAAMVRATENTLAELEGKLRANGSRGAELAIERQALAHEAHTVGGQARTKLKELTREFADLKLEGENISSALHHAQRNVDAARSTLEQIIKRDTAAKICALADDYEAAGVQAHDLFLQAFDAFARAKAIFQEIRILGGIAPDHFRIRVMTESAMCVYRLKSEDAHFVLPLPAPSARHPLDDAIRAAADQTRQHAKRGIAASEVA